MVLWQRSISAIVGEGTRNATKIIPHNKLHTRDLFGGKDAKWLPLSGNGDSDRTGHDGRFYRGYGAFI